MAIATGTAALIAAGIAAGGTVAATKIQANAANKAGRLQKESTDAALAHEREQDAYVRSKYEKEEAREEEARRLYQQYLAANGKGPAPAARTQPENMSPVAVAARAAVMQPGSQGPQPTAPTLRDLAPGGQAPAAAATQAPPAPDMASQGADVSTMPTLADIGRWNEWDPYLNRAAQA